MPLGRTWSPLGVLEDPSESSFIIGHRTFERAGAPDMSLFRVLSCPCVPHFDTFNNALDGGGPAEARREKDHQNDATYFAAHSGDEPALDQKLLPKSASFNTADNAA